MFPKQEGPKVQKWAFHFLGGFIMVFMRLWCTFVSMNSLGKSLSEKLQHYYYSTITIFDIREAKSGKFQNLPFFFLACLAKGHVSFCHHLVSVVRRRTLLYLNLLLWNYWTKSFHTWRGWPLGGDRGSLSQWCPTTPPSIQEWMLLLK